MKIAVLGPLARAETVLALEGIAGVEALAADKLEGLGAAAADVQALVLPGYLYDAAMAKALPRTLPRLRWLQFLTAGIEGAQLHGVPPGVTVTNAGDAWSPAVAEHTMTLLLCLYRRIPETLAAQARARWDRGFFPGMLSVTGRTMAIVGFGSIGRELAVRARAFGMRVVGVNRSGRPEPSADAIRKTDALRDVLAEADVVVVAVPHAPGTARLFDADLLAACKPGAVFINIARGALVDTAALEAAVRSGHLAGAGLDVTDPEPLPDGHSLWHTPNVIISPHVAGAAGPALRERLATVVEDNVRRFVAGEPLRHVAIAGADGAAPEQPTQKA